ncbi:hypothetical protein NL676_008244 [Syzygium grande]|nr:hypothetical protein NL676_008244 [Syzygium grande]
MAPGMISEGRKPLSTMLRNDPRPLPIAGERRGLRPSPRLKREWPWARFVALTRDPTHIVEGYRPHPQPFLHEAGEGCKLPMANEGLAAHA